MSTSNNNARPLKTTINNPIYKNKFIKVMVTYEIELPKAEVDAFENADLRKDFGERDTKILNMFDKHGYYDIDIEYNDEPYYIDGDLE